MPDVDHKRCLACGYILDGLPEPRCPECGRAFDPARPETYQSRCKSGRGHLLWALAALIAVSLPLGRLFTAGAAAGAAEDPLCVILLVFGYMSAFALVAASLAALRETAAVPMQRHALVASLLIAMLILLAGAGQLFLIVASGRR
jgi:hypothetical protein